jgi:hypothetical protein
MPGVPWWTHSEMPGNCPLLGLHDAADAGDAVIVQADANENARVHGGTHRTGGADTDDEGRSVVDGSDGRAHGRVSDLGEEARRLD